MSPTPIRFADLPATGQPLGGGTFAGITTHADGKHYAEVLLPDQDSNLNHQRYGGSTVVVRSIPLIA